ncbi:MAG: hypothetical protein LBV27_06775 [Oscillospiraceae bacterium]|jgi:putative membrane protein|nr:hypothetical protein [Oscillospiraceae bacterium]
MKNAYKRIGGLALAGLIALNIASPAAASGNGGLYHKDEIIYVNLDHSGAVDNIYVVNSFNMPSAGSITDYGNYSRVVNLTNTQPLSLDGGVVSATVPDGQFYYEGVLEDKDIPWDITVSYTLDGKALPGETLAGQSGRLDIQISLRQRSGANSIWREHYAVQASLSLDSATCSDITAPDATVAIVGDQRQLSYIILPGNDRDFTITATVREFEMGGISFNMIPLSLTIDDPDTAEIRDKMTELQDSAIELDDGAHDLDDGASRLDDGADQLSDGVTRLEDGVIDLADGVGELRDGANDLRDGADDLLHGALSIRKGAGQLESGAGQLALGSAVFATGLTQLSSQSDFLRGGSAQIREGLGQLSTAAGEIDEENIAGLHSDALLLKDGAQSYADMLEILVSQYKQTLAEFPVGYSGPEAQAVQNTLDILTRLQNSYAVLNTGVSGMADAVALQTGSLPQLAASIQALSGQYTRLDSAITAYTQGVDTLYGHWGTFSKGVDDLADGIADLKDGSAELHVGAQELYDGTYDLKDGVGKLTDGTTELGDGILELKDGTVELRDGTLELLDGTRELRDGTLELREKTGDMDGEVDERIDEILERYRSSDFEPVSFVSPQNRNVSSVQFVMKTAEIAVEDDMITVRGEESNPSLWQKFLNLFSFIAE